MKSVIARVIIATLIALPGISPSSLSPDPNFMVLLMNKVEELGLLIGSGTTSGMSKALPFVIDAARTSSQTHVCPFSGSLFNDSLTSIFRSKPV